MEMLIIIYMTYNNFMLSFFEKDMIYKYYFIKS